MLDMADKKWISEEMDRRFAEHDAKFTKMIDERFAEHDAKFTKMIDERFAEHDAKFTKMIDERFTDMEEKVKTLIDEKIAEGLGEIKRYFEMLIETELKPMLQAHIEILPSAHKSYDELESRVSDLEVKYEVIEDVVKTRS